MSRSVPIQRLTVHARTAYDWQFRYPYILPDRDRLGLHVPGEGRWPDLCPVDWTGLAEVGYSEPADRLGSGIPWWTRQPVRLGSTSLDEFPYGYSFDWRNFDRCSQVAEE